MTVNKFKSGRLIRLINLGYTSMFFMKNYELLSGFTHFIKKTVSLRDLSLLKLTAQNCKSLKYIDLYIY
jgi:hypothetical protein